MKLKTLLSTLACLTALTIAASGVDYQSMNTADRASLVTRFQNGDTTLTGSEIAKVYYGSVFDPGFIPGGRDYSTINSLRSARRYREMLPMCIEALKSDPSSLTLLFRTFAGAFNNPDGRDQALVDKTRIQVNQVCDAIFASGTGVTEDSPFEVVAHDDIEQFLINYLQVDSITGTAEMGKLTVAKVKLPGKEEQVYLYFKVYK